MPLSKRHLFILLLVLQQKLVVKQLFDVYSIAGVFLQAFVQKVARLSTHKNV